KRLVIKSVVLSIFSDDGPIPVVALLNEKDGIRILKKDAIKDFSNGLDYGSLLQIAMKSISLLMGEKTYQDGQTIERVKYFGILPFPDKKMDGLTYFFLIPDEKARGSARASTITILVEEKYRNFFYDNMSELRVLLAEHVNEMDKMVTDEEFAEIMVNLLNKLNNLVRKSSVSISLKRNIKILFSGLDNSGKTSMILSLEKKYSEIFKITPTQGVSRYKTSMMGFTISVWDMAGQSKYRKNYLKESQIYLLDCDILYFLVDVLDKDRYDESLKYFSQILDAFKKFDQYPPILLCFHKFDPDLDPDVLKQMEPIKEHFLRLSKGFLIKTFTTSIFNLKSISNAFKYGLSIINPNRELFQFQIEKYGKELDALAVHLLNENGLILADYNNTNNAYYRELEVAAPYFTGLYKCFNANSKDQTCATCQFNEMVFRLYLLKYENFSLFLLLTFNENFDASVVESTLSEFKEKIKELMFTI
ncbi:MAG: ADP-ribosylation factor-like protein, partial [Promethearchaeota archaeon]